MFLFDALKLNGNLLAGHEVGARVDIAEGPRCQLLIDSIFIPDPKFLSLVSEPVSTSMRRPQDSLRHCLHLLHGGDGEYNPACRRCASKRRLIQDTYRLHFRDVAGGGCRAVGATMSAFVRLLAAKSETKLQTDFKSIQDLNAECR